MKAIFFFIMPFVFVGAVIGAYPGFLLYRYTWEDASFCTKCHVHDYASVGWENSIHGTKTTCHDCHHQPLRAYLKETYLMITNPPTFPEDLHHTPYVKKDLCAACHVSHGADRSTITGPMKYEDVEKIPKVDLSHLHKIHLDKTTEFTLLNSHELTAQERNAEKPEPLSSFPMTKGEARSIVCADCHGGPANRGHNFGAVDASCVRCHQDSHKSQMAQTYGCRNCHFAAFLIPHVEKKPEEAARSTKKNQKN